MPPFGSIPYVPIPYAGGNATARLADLIRQSGQDRANAAQNSGAIQAYMWGNLGNNLTNTINNIAQIQANAPLKKAQMQEIQARTGELQAQAEARQQQQADVRAIDQAQSPIVQGVPMGMQGPPDPSQGTIIPSQEQILAHLRESGNGHLVAGIQKQFDDAAKSADAVKQSKANLVKAADEHRQTVAGHFGALRYILKANGGDPVTTAHAFQNALTTFGDEPDVVQQINEAKQRLGPNPTAADVLALADSLPTTTEWADKEKALTPPDYTIGNQRFSGKTNQVVSTGQSSQKGSVEQQALDAYAKSLGKKDSGELTDADLQAYQQRNVSNQLTSGMQKHAAERNYDVTHPVPTKGKSQQDLEQEYRTVLTRGLSSRSGGLGLEDAKVQQANHLLALMDQSIDPKSGQWNIPKVQMTELALGLARLLSPTGQVGVQLENELNQATAKGDLNKALTYITGTPFNGSTQDIYKMFHDSIDRQGQVAETNREGEMSYLRGLAPTDLEESRRQSLEANSLNPLRQSRVIRNTQTGETKTQVSTDGGKTWK